MLIERVNNEVIIKIPSNIIAIKELQQLLDYLRYREIVEKSKAKSVDLIKLVNAIKKKRKV
jgi:hypothetical protein